MSPSSPRPSGIRTVLQYTGIPPSWLDKRPKLPSRNWLIFLSATGSLVSYYAYDRRQCRKIRQHYVDEVSHFSEEPLPPTGLVRKVTVLGCKWPGDEDYGRSLRHFRKYVKPVLVSAAVDYDMMTGKRQGELARIVEKDVLTQRGLVPDASPASPEERERALGGGIVLVGRPAIKEFMAGLYRGWKSDARYVDREEALANSIASDGHFDELDHEESHREIEPMPRFNYSSSKAKPAHSGPPVPPLPPLLFVSFTEHLGFKQVPLMIWDFFNERHKVRSGAEAGYRLVMAVTRPIVPPSVTADFAEEAVIDGDLAFDAGVERYYPKWFLSTVSSIEKARKEYYDGLSARLATARQLARGEREPMKDEIHNPPPTEVELRAERLKKELRWRGDIEGFDIVKPSATIPWDDRFRHALRIFVDPADQPESSRGDDLQK
ncbi:hypothetical protein FISHEDRAFT_38397 [Fistulina hepatica ATCC 64428]|nr:hypothetical protein FISHEDRAFT_38397 [Fistulina hepatica ATCC 64428]